MKLPLPTFFEKKEKTDYFLAALLRDDKVKLILFEEISGKIKVITQHEEHFETSLETIAKDLGCASAQAKPAVSGHKTAAIIKASTGTMVFVQTTGRPPALPESHKAGIVAQGTKV